MGLDQYAFARNGNDKDIKIMEWRKHANLEGWMSDLYQSRGGKEEFNCIELKLEAKDIADLKREHLNLVPASGFFWGSSSSAKDDQTSEFISSAEKYLSEGYEIIYTSWW